MCCRFWPSRTCWPPTVNRQGSWRAANCPIRLFPAWLGANTVTVQFKPFGVKLEFTGIIEDDNTIRLKVFPEVSSLDFCAMR